MRTTGCVETGAGTGVVCTLLTGIDRGIVGPSRYTNLLVIFKNSENSKGSGKCYDKTPVWPDPLTSPVFALEKIWAIIGFFLTNDRRLIKFIQLKLGL
jgi:hypothetical protein